MSKFSPKLDNQKLYFLLRVPGRSAIILGHYGNWAGDDELGYRTRSLGCILLGRKRAVLARQDAITDTIATCKAFLKFADGRPLVADFLDLGLGVQI